MFLAQKFLYNISTNFEFKKKIPEFLFSKNFNNFFCSFYNMKFRKK